MSLTIAVTSWNEVDHLERLILSCLRDSDLVDELVVLDHRSTDGTQEMLDDMEPLLERNDIVLNRLYEPRDLSPALTMADLRQKLLRASQGPTVAMLDADFILGPGWRQLISKSIKELSKENSPYFATGAPIPVIWDNLNVNQNGVIESHGRIWVHPANARIVWKPAVSYHQNAGGGKWEVARSFNSQRQQRLALPNDHAIVSVNIKPQERIEQRKTMTHYMEAVMKKKITATWQEAYQNQKINNDLEYEFVDVDLRGHPLNVWGFSLP
jgi:glycosyltransferase involved in cell wall biosynthesis